MLIKIGEVKEHKDGSATVTVEYGKGFENLIKKVYNKKRVTKKLVEKVVNDGLRNYLKSQEKA